MSNEFKLIHGPAEYKLKYNSSIDGINPSMFEDGKKLFRLVDELNVHIPLKEFKIVEINATDMEYKITAWDNRVWLQSLKIPTDGSEPSMTFSVPAFWKLSEFAAHREIRGQFPEMKRKHSITEFKVTWSSPVYS